jgi:hypothetical protein
MERAKKRIIRGRFRDGLRVFPSRWKSKTDTGCFASRSGFLRTLLESQHPMVARVGDVNVARSGMRNHAVWFAELSLQGRTGYASVAFLANPGEGDELALG